jgi:hypothetical protein
MERGFNFFRDIVLVACAVIAAYFAAFPAASISGTAAAAPMPWWVAGIGLLAIVLFIVRVIPVAARVIRPPFEFFPDRTSLQRAHGSLADRLEKVETAWAIWVIGQKFYHAEENTDRVKRLLLPDPSGESFKYHIGTGPYADAVSMVNGITNLAKAKGAEVRWYRHFACHSIILADVTKRNGWVHIESVFPYSTTDQRPSYTIYRRSNRRAIAEMTRIFEGIWSESVTQ